jgi:hypothetical protein
MRDKSTVPVSKLRLTRPFFCRPPVVFSRIPFADPINGLDAMGDVSHRKRSSYSLGDGVPCSIIPGDRRMASKLPISLAGACSPIGSKEVSSSGP